MSNAVFPDLPGLKWDRSRVPNFSTKVQRSVSGRELSLAFYATPIWKWGLSFEFLRDDASRSLYELDTLAAFFGQRRGAADNFLYNDVNDNAVSAHGFGVGDAVTAAFQLQRAWVGPNKQSYWDPAYFNQSTLTRTNYLGFSQQFDNAAWTKIFNGTGYLQPVVTPSYGIAPDGTPTAERVVCVSGAGTTGSDYSMIKQGSAITSIPGANTTRSIWVKSNTGLAQVAALGSNGNSVLQNIPATGWVRLSYTYNHPTLSLAHTLDFGLLGSIAGNPSKTLDVLVWEGQLEDGVVAGPNITTGAAAATVTPNYWPKNGDAFEPIYNLNPATELQVFRKDWQGTQRVYQTSRTNLCLQSENFGTTWTTTNLLALSLNATAAPDGATTADLITENTVATTQHYIIQTFAGLIDNAVYKASIFVKPNGRTRINLNCNNKPSAQPQAVFDLTGAGSVVSSSAVLATNIVPLANGWYKCEITYNMGTGGTTPGLAVLLVNSGTNTTYTGDGVSGVYLWGADLKATSVFDSYIGPTTTTAVTVTDITVNASGLVTFSTAPLAGAQLTWTGQYYWRVRFAVDQLDFSNFVQTFWELKKVELVSVR